MTGTLHPQGSVKSTKWKLTWLPQLPEELVDLQLVDFDHLLTKRKLEEDDTFEEFVNENSVWWGVDTFTCRPLQYKPLQTFTKELLFSI